MKRIFYFTPFLLFYYLFGQNTKKFDDYDGMETFFREYIRAVDGKNINEISNFFDHDRCTLHYGTNQPIVLRSKDELDDLFRKWTKSPKSFFTKTRIDKIEIAPVWDDPDTKLCTVDALFSRLDDGGRVISRGRSLYHFYRGENSYPYRIIKRWKKWKIYMITDLALENENLD